MRVFLFDTENGLFSGEDYCDLKDVREEEGITTVPPPVRQPETVPVYDRTVGNWKLVPKEVIGDRTNA